MPLITKTGKLNNNLSKPLKQVSLTNEFLLSLLDHNLFCCFDATKQLINRNHLASGTYIQNVTVSIFNLLPLKTAEY